MMYIRDMEITRVPVSKLEVGDNFIVIDEIVIIRSITPDYVNGRTRIDFAYDRDGIITSWLLFKPNDAVILWPIKNAIRPSVPVTRIPRSYDE